jgi:hypothetical protein
MKILLTLFLCLSFIGIVVATTENDLTGKWTCVADAGQPLTINMELKQDGENLTGTTVSDLGNGKIDGGKVTGKTFTATLHADIQGQPVDFKMDGTLDGDKITGSFANVSFGTIPYAATRNK